MLVQGFMTPLQRRSFGARRLFLPEHGFPQGANRRPFSNRSRRLHARSFHPFESKRAIFCQFNHSTTETESSEK